MADHGVQTSPPPVPRKPVIDFSVRGKLSPRADMVIGLLGIMVLVILWCIATYSGLVDKAFLPTPTRLWEGLVSFHEKGWLFPAIWRSFWRVTKALMLVMLIGIPIGILMGAFAPVDAFLRKIVNGVKSVPTTGILGLVVLWVGLEDQGKVIFLFLGAIFYMIILVRSAVQSVNEDYIKVALDIGANRWQMITRVILPAAVPQLWEAIAVCNGIMWTYIVLAEYINSNEMNLGIGYLLSNSSKFNETGGVFAALIIIALISAFTDWALQSVRKRFLNW